ncbi:MAG: DUF393 domain-containing protein [Pseudomonadota bacterium]
MERDSTDVLYNADCPVCRFEIDHYADYTARTALPIRFDDLNSEDMAQWDIDPDDAARRLHVRKDGQVYAGIPAFLVLWSDMPRYRWLARLIGLPVIRQVASAVYDYVLAPALYAWHRRRVAAKRG